jgi:tripartite-type tricarboxylate transporter receptor subunit TctC
MFIHCRALRSAATDYSPVVLVADESIVLVARKDFPSDNLWQFIAYAKAPWQRWIGPRSARQL